MVIATVPRNVRRFAICIRLLYHASLVLGWRTLVGGEVIGIDSVRFDIADTKNHLHAYYDYRQDAIGVSLVPVAVTLGGTWTRFPTDTEIHISDFDGPCRYSTGSVASLSVNYLTMKPKGGATTIPATLKMTRA